MISRTLGAPIDTLPTEGADRNDAIDALAVSLFNQMRAGGAPITMEEARAMAADQANATRAPAPIAPAPVSENNAASLLTGGPAEIINPALREQPAPPKPSADQLRRSSYNAHRSRVARMAEQAGVSADEAESMLLRGYEDQGIRITPNGRGGLALEGPGGAPTASEMGAAMSELSNLAIDRRIADQNARKEAWRSQAMLAGPNAARNAVNLFNTLPEEWRNVVAAGRLTPRLSQTGVTPLGRDAAAAGGDDRIRALQLQIAAEDARAQRQMQQQMMQFQATQTGADADRDMRAQQFEAEQAARLAALQQNANQVAARMNLDLQLNRENAGARAEEAAAEQEARLAIARVQHPDPTRAMQQQWLAQRQQSMLTGDPGRRDLIEGRYKTGPAVTQLKQLALDNDSSLIGFSPENAVAFDAALTGIADEAERLTGNARHPFRDPAVRRQIIQRYGLAPWLSGGRGGILPGSAYQSNGFELP